MTENTSRKGLIAFILLVTLTVILALVNFGLSRSENRGSDFSFSAAGKPYVAVIKISGVIQAKGPEYNQAWLLSKISELKKDSKNLGIMLFIESPGGTVYHADEAYLALKDYKESGKKVYAYFGAMAASGGYYIACAADKIFANRNTLTGSIGVISGSAVDATELLKKIGIKTVTIHSGKNKNMMNYNEPFTKEQQEIMQSISDECYQQFTEIVADGRKMKLSKVKKLADGRIYTAAQAKACGLVDEICTFEQAEKNISGEFNIQNLNFKLYQYEKADNLRSLLMEGISIIKNPQVINQGNPMSYLYTGN